MLKPVERKFDGGIAVSSFRRNWVCFSRRFLKIQDFCHFRPIKYQLRPEKLLKWQLNRFCFLRSRQMASWWNEFTRSLSGTGGHHFEKNFLSSYFLATNVRKLSHAGNIKLRVYLGIFNKFSHANLYFDTFETKVVWLSLIVVTECSFRQFHSKGLSFQKLRCRQIYLPTPLIVWINQPRR